MRDKNKETIVPLILIRFNAFFYVLLIDSDIPITNRGEK